VLSANALIFSGKTDLMHEKVRRFLRVLVIVLYVGSFIVLNFTYLFTGQMTRLQTVLFILGIAPFFMIAAATAILILFILAIIALIHRKFRPKDSCDHEKRNLKILLFSSIGLFILLILSNAFLLRIENPLITNKDLLINYHEQETVLGPKISGIKESYAGKNVVFIMLESMSAERLGAYGYKRDVSPNIDAIASKGIMFTNAYTTATHSDYAQPAILTSRYQLTNNLRTTFDDNSPRKFPWDVFKHYGYTTAYFSSQDDRWEHMDSYLRFDNLDYYSYSMTDGKADYGVGLSMKDYDHKTADLALEWLNSASGKPFFLYLNFQATHYPIEYPEEYSFFMPDNQTNKYDNAVRYVDKQIGRIIAFLEENNLTEDTIIAITSDHGEDLGKKHGIPGHGLSIYNDELIVPLIAYIPNAGHYIIDERVSNIDLLPTLIDLFSYDTPKELQGSVMRKGKPLFFYSQNHKYLIGMIEGDIKVIIDLNRNLVEVYNIKDDPDELNPLNTEKYSKQIVKLLFWHYCQLDYYNNQRWLYFEQNKCAINNNFMI
jgi:arylsulfatase A-like enzyme